MTKSSRPAIINEDGIPPRIEKCLAGKYPIKSQIPNPNLSRRSKTAAFRPRMESIGIPPRRGEETGNLGLQPEGAPFGIIGSIGHWELIGSIGIIGYWDLLGII